MDSNISVICLQTEAFEELLRNVVEQLREKYGFETKKWIQGEEVMKMLGIKSPTTLLKLRNEGRIRYSFIPHSHSQRTMRSS